MESTTWIDHADRKANRQANQQTVTKHHHPWESQRVQDTTKGMLMTHLQKDEKFWCISFLMGLLTVPSMSKRQPQAATHPARLRISIIACAASAF